MSQLAGAGAAATWITRNPQDNASTLPTLPDSVNGDIDSLPSKRLMQVLTPKDADPDFNYEQLEFIGDALLSASIRIFICRTYATLDLHRQEVLTRLSVDGSTCAEAAVRIGLHTRMNPTHLRRSQVILGDVFEALVAAFAAERGVDFAFRWTEEVMRDLVAQRLDQVQRTIEDETAGSLFNNKRQKRKSTKADLDNAVAETGSQQSTKDPADSAKSRLDHRCRVLGLALSYETAPTRPLDNDLPFHEIVRIGDAVMGRGSGSTRKKARQAAAQDAWRNESQWIMKGPA